MVERMLDSLVITSSIIVTGTMIPERSASSAWRAGAWMLLARLIAGLRRHREAHSPPGVLDSSRGSLPA